MGLFSRKPKLQGYIPTEAEIKAAADQLNAGNQKPADDLCARSGDYSQHTAMRILGYCIEEPS